MFPIFVEFRNRCVYAADLACCQQLQRRCLSLRTLSDSALRPSYHANEYLFHFCTVHVIAKQLCFQFSWNSRIAAYMQRIWHVVCNLSVQCTSLQHVSDNVSAFLKQRAPRPCCMCEVGDKNAWTDQQMSEVANQCISTWKRAATEHVNLGTMYQTEAPYMTMY